MIEDTLYQKSLTGYWGLKGRNFAHIVLKNFKKREEETFLLVIKRPFKYKEEKNEKDNTDAIYYSGDNAMLYTFSLSNK